MVPTCHLELEWDQVRRAAGLWPSGIAKGRRATLPSFMPPLHLLVLERDPARRDAILTLLRGAGHHAMAAPDGPAAATALALPGFDLLLLDLGDPDLDLGGLRQVLAPAQAGEPDSLDAA